MEMFLWTVGSFYGFGETVGFDLFFTSQIPFFRGNLILQLIVYLQRSIMSNVPKGFYILEKGFYMLEKGVIFRRRAFIFWRLPLWRYGGLDSANSANKVG